MIKSVFWLVLRALLALAKMAAVLSGAALLLLVILFKPLAPVWQAHEFSKEVTKVEKTTKLTPPEQMDLLDKKMQPIIEAHKKNPTAPALSGFALPEGVGQEAIEDFIAKHRWSYEIDKKRTLDGRKYLIVIPQ